MANVFAFQGEKSLVSTCSTCSCSRNPQVTYDIKATIENGQFLKFKT